MIEILLYIGGVFVLYIVIKYAVKHAIIEAMIAIKDDKKDDDLSPKMIQAAYSGYLSDFLYIH